MLKLRSRKKILPPTESKEVTEKTLRIDVLFLQRKPAQSHKNAALDSDFLMLDQQHTHTWAVLTKAPMSLE